MGNGATAAQARGRVRVGVDAGGTFTDVVALDEGGGLLTTKVPSTPADPSQAFMTGIAKVFELLDGAEVSDIAHGTTVATNALLQDDFTGLGFVTTAGFTGLLEIGRQSVPESYGNSYFWVKPDRIVPLHLVKGVRERMGASGEVVLPFDEAQARRVARWFRRRGVTAIGVCFLHAYLNPAHERRMREVLAEEHPDCAVSLSCDVLAEYREYERSLTTLIDAFVKPRISAYVSSLEDRLEELYAPGGPPRFYVMKSNGGVIAGREVDDQPVTTILSGPAAGTLGAAFIAQEAGFERIVALDGGGTSTDVTLVTDGRPILTTDGRVGRFTIKMPMVDVVAVGTGGGSIAAVAPDGTLKVGPRSAGADPGPICYRRGGAEPTITDAALALGHLPAHLLGGEVALDRDAAKAALERLGDPLGLSPDACAAGVLEIAAWNQANAIRQITVRRGIDVRDYDLCAFGGSGPLMACRLLHVLSLPSAFIPPNPANLSAFGLLTTDVRTDHVQTWVRRPDEVDLAELAAMLGRLESSALKALEAQHVDLESCHLVRSADLRYRGQAFEVRVPAPSGAIDAPYRHEVEAAFHVLHESLYGYCYRDDPAQGVEWVNLRVAGVAAITRPTLPRIESGGGDAALARTGERLLFADGEWTSAALFDRARLRAGDEVRAPAVIEEFGSTLPVLDGFVARVDDWGNLVVRRESVR